MTAQSVAEKTRIKPDATVAVINPIAGIGGSPGLPAGVRFVHSTTGVPVRARRVTPAPNGPPTTCRS